MYLGTRKADIAAGVVRPRRNQHLDGNVTTPPETELFEVLWSKWPRNSRRRRVSSVGRDRERYQTGLSRFWRSLPWAMDRHYRMGVCCSGDVGAPGGESTWWAGAEAATNPLTLGRCNARESYFHAYVPTTTLRKPSSAASHSRHPPLQHCALRPGSPKM